LRGETDEADHVFIDSLEWQGEADAPRALPGRDGSGALERVNAKIKRRTDKVGVVPNEAAIVRPVGAILLEQNDEWQPQRRHLQLEGLQALGDNQPARLSAVMS